MEQKQQEKPQDSNVLHSLRPSRIIIPILIGLCVTVYMLYNDIVSNNLLDNFKNPAIFWIVMAIVALLVRDGFYIYRIRHLTQKNLTWTGSFYTIILWEFSSAISPTAVGGTAVAAFILLKEGISFGKSLAYVLVSAILDNMFFILVGAVVLTLNTFNFYPNSIFHLDAIGVPEGTVTILKTAFYASYTVVFVYNGLMAYGLFVKPQAIKWIFVKVTSFAWFKRWQKAAEHQGDELIIASAQLKGVGATYWFKAIGSTIVIWSARYLIVNCLIAAFFTLNAADHGLIFSRHVILWVVLVLAVTPGAAGIAEYAFKGFYTPFAGVLTGVIAIAWRMLTFYPYLIMGAVFLPRWIARVFYEKPKE